MKVRFAPSPTGYLHIGGARTALFNWMYAKSNNGKFVLRIEDTDQSRSQKEYLDEILESMKWLGMEWDELYKQSERFDIYRKYAEQLLSEGKAYKDGEAIILKMPTKEIKLYDLIRGEITFDSATLKDQVLMKSDGSPAYSFCCVIDDALMEITCVVRGEDHISNTPKQMVIYEALGFKIPKFAHLPLIMGADGSRMSKRTGAVAVSDYKKDGFLSEALVNYLMLLGWSPGNNQEIVSLKNAVKNFSIKKINKASAVFSMEKLCWVNAQYIKQIPTERLIELLVPYMKEKGLINGDYDSNTFKDVVELYKGRLSKLTDFIDWAGYVFLDRIEISPELREEYSLEAKEREFSLLRERFQQTDPFDAKTAEESFRRVVEELGIKAGDLVHPVRVALTGNKVGPSLFDTMAVLGRDKTIQRLSDAVGSSSRRSH